MTSPPPPSSQAQCKWSVGQLINVKPRTWAGINRPGGVGKITKLHYSNGFVESLDVKYLVGSGTDTKLDLDFCQSYQPLESKGRSRRGRDFYVASPAKRKDNAAAGGAKGQNNNPRDAKRAKTEAAAAAADENTDPKAKTSTTASATKRVVAAARPKTSSIRRKKQVKKTPKHDKKLLPATHVTVSNKKGCYDDVSPLRDTPAELRHAKSKSSSLKVKSDSTTTAKSAAASKRTHKTKKPKRSSTEASKPSDTALEGGVTLQSRSSSDKANGDFCIQKVPRRSRPIVSMSSKHGSSHGGTGAAVAAATNNMAAATRMSNASAAAAASGAPSSCLHAKKRLALQRVYESQVKSANSFVEGLMSASSGTSTTTTTNRSSSNNNNKDTKNTNVGAAECTPISLSPPNTERIDLFVSTLSELVGDGDDGVDKAHLLDKINKKLLAAGGHQQSQTGFDGQEMEDCLSTLVLDGKVMVSDGIVYSF